MIPFDFSDEMKFRRAWEAVEIVRPVRYALFTFGQSELPYWLVCQARKPGEPVRVRQGEIRVDRPLILTPDNVHPEFHNFFDDPDDDDDRIVSFLLARTVAFSNLKLTNQCRQEKLVSDSMEEVVARLNRQLDDDEEDRVAILTAPARLAGVAMLKYATERIVSSAPDNVQELRERGFLP